MNEFVLVSEKQSNVAEPVSLVIFDCDGVLVDTEKFYVELLLEFSAPFGLILTLPQAMEIFAGVTLRRCMEIIEERSGKQLPVDFFQRFSDEFARRIEYSIKPIEGIKEALDEIDLPICVASNSSMGSLKQMLGLVGLDSYFAGGIFSAYDLKKWKPEPDVFLKAASEMMVEPRNCLVIEDSLPGVQAAQAAGMKVFAYAASEFTHQRVLSSGAVIFRRMSELPGLIRGLSAHSERASA